MHMKKIFLLISTLFIAFNAISQELPNIIPLSPNAAAIAKYGEIPVSHFTGVPNINIPIYTIKSGELTLPLSLSYHAGGNKVEAIASWVGLGWSLNTVPSISRSVRGIPDDAQGGYFSKIAGKTVKEIWDEQGSAYDDLRAYLYSGERDSEPDIFYYNLPGESGKFFYNQKSDAFITFPKSNLRIERDGNNFRLTTQDGIESVFNIKETTKRGNSSGAGHIITSWYASEIISASKKDTISLVYDYEQEEQHFYIMSPITKYLNLSTNQCGSIENNNGPIMTVNYIRPKLLDIIYFKNGYLKFNKDSVERDDLKGGHSLNNISVYNNNNQLISKYEFTYKYIQGNGCQDIDGKSNKWMLLDKIETVSSDLTIRLPHRFEYNETNIPYCRTSAAQDYWGYYNGEDENTNLIPPTGVPNSLIPAQVGTANRQVDTVASQFAILQKITYPTGGCTEFEFENNIASAEDLPPQYVEDYKILAGDYFFGPYDTIPQKNEFQSLPFTIDNPPDEFLNGYNEDNGGAFVNFDIDRPGCDLRQGASPCARFMLYEETTPSNYRYKDDFDMDDRYYLPNGNYMLKAEFDQEEDPQYQGFIFIAKWYKIDPTQNDENRYAGGLRIKEIRNFPNSLSSTIIKRYKYTIDYNSTTSSGDVFSPPDFCFSENIYYDDWEYVSPKFGWSICHLVYLRVRSFSNIQQISHSGSFVGYKNVIEETHNAEETGYTNYKFSHKRDATVFYGFPYVPYKSHELERGQLLEEIKYKKSGTTFIPVQKRVLIYNGFSYDYSGDRYPVYSFGLKWANNLLTNLTFENDPLYGSYTLGMLLSYPRYKYAQNLVGYELEGGWSNLFKETTINYFGNDSTVNTTYYHYDNPDHLNLTRTETIDSEGNLLKSKTIYPQDIVNPTVAEQRLINQNRKAAPIQIETYKGTDLLSTLRTNYKGWYSNIILPDTIKTAQGDNALEERIIYHSYYNNGNVREVSKADDMRVVYVWGYHETLPIAKIENATYSQVQTYVANLKNLSDLDKDAISEDNLRRALNDLRTSLPNAMVYTYTHDPLVGMTSETNPAGQTTYYEYDGLGRLVLIRNHDTEIIKKFEYNYNSNGATIKPTLTTPGINPLSGTYATPQEVSIICSTVGASIYYTDNGSNPNENSSVYTTPITIAAGSTITIKAVAMLNGYNPSAIATAEYTIDESICTLEVDRNIITANPCGATYQGTFTTNQSDFSAVSSDTIWLTVNENVNPIKFTCTANTGALQREATITVTAGDCTDTINVIQDVPYLIISDIEHASCSGYKSVMIQTNMQDSDLSISESESWIFNATITSTYIRFYCPTNTTESTNIGSITINGCGLSDTVSVSQEPMTDYLDITPSSGSISPDGRRSFTATVSSNVSWSVPSSIGGWLTATKSGNTIVFSANENNSGIQRSATVTVSGTGMCGTLSDAIIITQDEYCFIAVSPNVKNISYQETTFDVVVNTNQPGFIIDDSPYAQSVVNGSTVTITCEANNSINPREILISFVADGGAGDCYTVLTINQVGN